MSSSLLRSLIYVAVAQHATRPNTGVLLSGGIDSSTVASVAKYVAGPLPTFTGYYDGELYDERRYATLAKGRPHHEIHITPGDFVDHFDDMIADVEPPYAGPGTFGQWMVARYVAAEGIETVLSGEGGDELFGGYARLMMVAGGRVPDGYDNYRPPDDYPNTVPAALQYDWDRLPDLLRVDEQVTAAHGIRAVAPMLEPAVTDYVLSLPPELRLGKQLLRDAMRGLVPDPILRRTDKRGFPVPFVEWAQREPVRSFVADRIGYVPASYDPWGRQWWYDLCTASAGARVAA
jgi:asparagine synthetase B (glutamine-hydrolysing)